MPTSFRDTPVAGPLANRPSPDPSFRGLIYKSTDTGQVDLNDGKTWQSLSPPSGTFVAISNTVDDLSGKQLNPIWRIASTSHPTGPVKAYFFSTSFSGDGSTFLDPELNLGFWNEGSEISDGLIFEQDFWTNAGMNNPVTNKALTNNVATLTTQLNHGLVLGQHVTVQNVDAVFNGTYTLTGVTANTFSYALGHANIASTPVIGGQISFWHHQAEQHSVFVDKSAVQHRVWTWAGEYLTGQVQLSYNVDYWAINDGSGNPVASYNPGQPWTFFKDVAMNAGNGLSGDITAKTINFIIDGNQAPANAGGPGGGSMFVRAAPGSPSKVVWGNSGTDHWQWYDAGSSDTLYLRDLVQGRQAIQVSTNASVDFRAVIITSQTQLQAGAGQSAPTLSVQSTAGVGLWEVTVAGLPKWTAVGNQQTTVGAAGAASALPAQPTAYLKVVNSAGTTLVVPAYAAS